MGAKRGLIRSVLHWASTVISFVAAFFLTKPAAGFLNGQFGWEESLDNWINSSLKFLSGAVSGKILLTIITAISLFIIIRLVLLILDKWFKHIKDSIKVINTLDRFLGFFFGIAVAFITIISLYMTVDMLSNIDLLKDLPTWLQLTDGSGSKIAAPAYGFSKEHIFPIVSSILEKIILYAKNII
jgi:uncharacterized membrane protein required for colicin V production